MIKFSIYYNYSLKEHLCFVKVMNFFLQKYVGKFLLSCLPSRSSKHEYITVTPDGYRFRSQNFDSIGSLFRWYKEHFRDATPHVTPAASRSAGQSYGPSPHTGKYYIICLINIK